MTSWTDSLPERRPGEALRDIRFRNEIEPTTNERTQRVVGNFRHRDGRIWNARIVPIPPQEGLPFQGPGYQLTLTSGGCRNYQFVSRSLVSAKQTAVRFSNMQMALYERIIADAHGTTEFPRSNDIGVFRIAVVKTVPVRFQHRETQRYDVEGLGRLEHGHLVIFPQSAELEEIFDEVADEGTFSLIPDTINSPTIDNSLFSQSATMRDAARDVLSEDERNIADIVLNNFNDSAEEALQGLTDGTYRIPAPRQREDRVIDLGGDDD